MSICRRIPRPGLFISLFASILMAAATVISGSFVTQVDPVLPSLLMYTILAFVSTPFMLKDNEWHEATLKQWIFAIISGILSGVYIFTRLESMKYVEPVDTAALTQTQLVFVVIISFIWLKEPVGIYEAFFIILIVTGSFLVTQPSFLFGSTIVNTYNKRYIGIILAFVTAICSAFMSCIVRSLHTINPYLIAFLQGVSAGCVLVIIYTVKSTLLPPDHLWLLIIFGSFCGGMTVLLYTFAYKLEAASFVTAMSSFEMVTTVLLQIAIINLYPDWITVLGALFIMIGVIALPIKSSAYGFIRARFYTPIDT